MARPAHFALGALAAALLASQAGRVPEALAEIESFRVADVELEGARYLGDTEVRRTLALDPLASVWDDPAPLEARLERHPLVLSARVGRRLPSTLVVEVRERQPVALLSTPTLEPIDADGRPLPLDPATSRLDLPLLHVPAGIGEGSPPGPAAISRPVRVLAGEAARLAESEPAFVDMVSELAWVRHDEAVAVWGDPGVMIRFRPPLTARRVRRAMDVLADAAARRPGSTVELVDLRWEDQVVVRYRGAS